MANVIYDNDKLYSTGARMPGRLRNKLVRLAEAEGRFVSESEMVRLLIDRAPEPLRQRRRQRPFGCHAAA